MKKVYISLAILVIVIGAWVVLASSKETEEEYAHEEFSLVQSVDTMKYSRDLARQYLHSSSFDTVIRAQMSLIKDSGATHVALGTPYDEEFIPFLSRWVSIAREYGLSVWFRGNFSGWEGWFDYSKINREEHKKLLENFLAAHQNLFQDNDIFSPCPECENGGPGDPRTTGDAAGYNKFLIEEYEITQEFFEDVDKDISVLFSMNGDIARDILNKDTANSLGGMILVDHYVSSPEQFVSDLKNISSLLDAKVGIGEFGAPIIDLHGYLTENEQAEYIKKVFDLLYISGSEVSIMNYWVLTGGSTALTSSLQEPRESYKVVQSYYRQPVIIGIVTDTFGKPLSQVKVSAYGTEHATFSNSNGSFAIKLSPDHRTLAFEKDNFMLVTTVYGEEIASTTQTIVLEPVNQSMWFKLKKFWFSKKT